MHRQPRGLRGLTPSARRIGGRHLGRHLGVLVLVLVWAFRGHASAAPDPGPPRHVLSANGYWRLNLPDQEPFGASALLRLPAGHLYTLSDRGPEVFRIDCLPGTNVAHLEMLTALFPETALEPFRERKTKHYDAEGLARDDQGRVYLCEETDRWILRCDPDRGTVERLDVDWSPVRQYFHRQDRNASFEGIAWGDGRLYVANERDQGRIIVVDPVRLKVLDDFEVRTHRNRLWDTHYSDLSWFQGRLYVLLRDSRAILQVHPATHAVEAEFDFAALESDPAQRYQTRVPFVGVMEGLAVDAEAFWLVTDNNDLGRVSDPKDRRPTLYRCERPRTGAP